jgi:hypothetical protein
MGEPAPAETAKMGCLHHHTQSRYLELHYSALCDGHSAHLFRCALCPTSLCHSKASSSEPVSVVGRALTIPYHSRCRRMYISVWSLGQSVRLMFSILSNWLERFSSAADNVVVTLLQVNRTYGLAPCPKSMVCYWICAKQRPNLWYSFRRQVIWPGLHSPAYRVLPEVWGCRDNGSGS